MEKSAIAVMVLAANLILKSGCLFAQVEPDYSRNEDLREAGLELMLDSDFILPKELLLELSVGEVIGEYPADEFSNMSGFNSQLGLSESGSDLLAQQKSKSPKNVVEGSGSPPMHMYAVYIQDSCSGVPFRHTSSLTVANHGGMSYMDFSGAWPVCRASDYVDVQSLGDSCLAYAAQLGYQAGWVSKATTFLTGSAAYYSYPSVAFATMIGGLVWEITLEWQSNRVALMCPMP